MVCYAIGSIIVSKSVKWARVINPILLTGAFMMERPIMPVYTDYYEVLNSCINVPCCYLIPWFVCETMAGQILSFIITFSACMFQLHIHFDFQFFAVIMIPYFIICVIVFIYFSYDLPNALKTSIR